MPAELIELHTNNGTRSMLEGKDFDELQSVLSFAAVLVDKAIDGLHRYTTTHVYTKFFELRHLLNYNNMEHVLRSESLNTILRHV